MEGKVKFSVLYENHEGPIGEDWRYWIEAKVFNQGLQGKGTIKVPKHSLPSGTTQAPPGPPASVEIPAGDYNNQIKVKLTLEATEVDLFRNDVGKTDIDLVLDCPRPGEDPRVHEQEISVGVMESPGISGEASIVTLGIQLVLCCS
ncbi:MAG: hypothetical protein HKP21_10800 [Xanthomonadales bacterium]|nr:hypothetical protein [Gammaproteobacteria bacterium]MBT8074184.1 hypothetical protein [Gammaproteobacteria bacterium]MBT8076870.1 hypothetical protein [Gammaproteobacteria bacterium]NNK05036.1 hypothetical protein [Xanthomonadales bacterium]NNK99742.1 hypothetical protein [Xanthomonadales bacterium]